MRIFHRILFLLLAVFCHVAVLADGGGEVLWWLVDDPLSSVPVDYYGLITSADAIGVTDARLSVMDSSGNVVGYLPLMGFDEDDQIISFTGETGIGVPGEYFADISDYADPAYSFAVELGQYSAGDWVKTLVWSETKSYTELAAHRVPWDDENLKPAYVQPWNPNSYAVPEPCSGMLVLLGLAALALKRRKRSD